MRAEMTDEQRRYVLDVDRIFGAKCRGMLIMSTGDAEAVEDGWQAVLVRLCSRLVAGDWELRLDHPEAAFSWCLETCKWQIRQGSMLGVHHVAVNDFRCSVVCNDFDQDCVVPRSGLIESDDTSWLLFEVLDAARSLTPAKRVWIEALIRAFGRGGLTRLERHDSIYDAVYDEVTVLAGRPVSRKTVPSAVSKSRRALVAELDERCVDVGCYRVRPAGVKALG